MNVCIINVWGYTEILPHLSFFHLDIRSLQNKADELSTLLSTLNIKFSVAGITETWLQDSSLGVNIDGYNFVFALPKRVEVWVCMCHTILILEFAQIFMLMKMR